jgi:hypothetical protein
MSDNLDKYLPEFDEDETRAKLAGFTREQLLDMLVYAYKEKRLWAKMLDGETKKIDRIQAIISEPSTLSRMPGVPTTEDIRRMIEDDEN